MPRTIDENLFSQMKLERDRENDRQRIEDSHNKGDRLYELSYLQDVYHQVQKRVSVSSH